jgi:hypothetical protein
LAVSVARVIWRDRLAKIADTKIIGIDTQWFIWYNLSSVSRWTSVWLTCCRQGLEFYRGNRGNAVEGEQNAVDYCGNDGNFLPYIVIFILFTVHYYFDTWIQMLIKSCVNYYFSLSFLRKKKHLKK